MSQSKARMQHDIRALRAEADQAHTLVVQLLQHVVDLHQTLYEDHGERHDLSMRLPEFYWRQVSV